MDAFRPKTVAVVAVYRPPADLPGRVEALADQVDAVVLVDDGSGALPSTDYDTADVHQIPLQENSGIARALNVGVRRARELGATHVLTLDQDTTVPAGYVDTMTAALSDARASESIAGAVPSEAGGSRVLRIPGSDAPFDPIQSGQILPMDVIDEVGPFDEALFIDAVDSEFWLRADLQGYRFVVVEGVTIEHGLGELKPIRVFGRHLTIAGRPRHVLYHSPFRTYYMVRNSVVLRERFSRQRRSWLRRRNRKMLEMIIGCILLADDRASQLRAVRAGLADGRSARLGKIADHRLAYILHGRRTSR